MCKKYRFGIDIDGTVTSPETFIPHINKYFNTSLTLKDITEYDLSNVLKITKNEFWKWMKQHEENIYKEADLALYAKEILVHWNSLHELFYISARPVHVHDLTMDWFQRCELPYDHIELLGQHNKLAAVKKHKIDLFFEDKHDNACAIAEECGIPVILLDTPYNQDSIPDLVYRVNNWKEAKTLIENIFN
ncbi:hypothetical protein QA612_14955 [Evansella sp. AB-P1]|uniref:5' nucleotidase, NT5C type n=1 Tax=Evansella sp. AB-P1 TaxID=3037653 RepID=UPI00241E72F3|nr:hypothetical protein [Evansella sp. AB-P1]MDG5788769.1 hypothetical protein [Evansella sp. AB-P1]